MKTQKIKALVSVELKKLYRDPMNLAVLLLMPVGLTLVFYFALGNLPTWNIPGMSHFEFLVPGTMGFAVIYMIMMVSMALCAYREAGLLKIAFMIIAVFQAMIVLLLSVILGFRPQGGLPGLALVVVFLGLLAITAVGLGLITATVAKSSGAASGLSMIFVVPMMVFGTFLAVFNDMTRTIARFTPNYYSTDSLILIFNGASLSDPVIWQNLLILAIISLVAVIAGIQLFKRTEFR